MRTHTAKGEGQMTRRNVLERMAIGAGALALAAQAAADDKSEKKPDGWIDAHVHVWTPDTAKYPLAKGYSKDDMKPPSFTPDQLFSHATPCGVSRIVLIQMSFYGFDNSYMLDSMREHPGVFSGVAVIDESSAPADEMRRLAKEGVRGFRILPGKRPVKTWLDGPGMAAMWKCGGEEGLAMCHLINPDSLPHVDRMCRKFPDTPVVIDHFARIGADGEVRSADVEQLAALAKHKQTSVKVSAYYALGKKKAPYVDLGPMIRQLLDAYGPERLMWASDCPYQVDPGHNYADSIDLIKDRLEFLSDGDKQWLLRKTAEKVFFS